MIAIVMYGCVGKEILRIPSYVRAFFEQFPTGEYTEEQVYQFTYEEVLVCQDYSKLGFPIYSSASKFGIVVSVSESNEINAMVELPRKIKRRFKKLLIPYDLYPSFWHFVIDVKE